MTDNSILRKQEIDLDSMIATVMPSSWEGHARLIIKQSDVVDPSVEDRAVDKALKLSSGTSLTPEAAAEKLVSKLEEHKGQ